MPICLADDLFLPHMGRGSENTSSPSVPKTPKNEDVIGGKVQRIPFGQGGESKKINIILCNTSLKHSSLLERISKRY